MNIIDPLVQSYAERFSSAEDALLTEIQDYTRTRPHAHMLSGPVQGKFLEMISRLMAPRRILEIGTFTGYSSLCLARGLAKNGQLHTIERRPEQAQIAAAYFLAAKMTDRIILHQGNALDIIPILDEDWDLVFIDADKPAYTTYYRLIMPRLRPGGLIIADNVLFHGQVLEPVIRSRHARAMHAFNGEVQKDESVDKVLLTVRDGLLLIRKKNS